MSVSLYKYTPACDGEQCPGDCDLCGKAQLSEEDATFNAENVELNTTQDVQSVGSVGDYISRQAAIDALAQIFDRCEEIEAHLPEGDPDRTGYKMYPDYLTVWKYLHQLPSAQPEIIRCKDCKHFATINEPYNETFCRLCFMNKSEMGYCDKAERRTDAEIH